MALVVPDRGDRKDFLEFAHYQMSRQTRKADIVVLVNDPPLSEATDLTYRYRIGIERAKEQGADLILCWENDDWYHHSYIEVMTRTWEQKGKPDLIGIENTIYYQIFNRKFHETGHNGRASMFCTGISANARLQFPDDSYVYTDMALWKLPHLTKYTWKEKYIAIGIKHGIGLCGGGGHPEDWRAYSHQDAEGHLLRTHMDHESFLFYESMAARHLYQYKINRYKSDPFLSIITRVYDGKRPEAFKKHHASILSQRSVDFEQIFIIDKVGRGMAQANRSFTFAKDKVRGRMIYLFDDDDFLTHARVVGDLKRIYETVGPDIIFVKAKILTGDGDNIYPKPAVWKGTALIRGQIGGGCVVVKDWIFQKHIHEFQRQRMGDFNYMNSILTKEKGLKIYWHDDIIVETGKVSRGATE